MGGNTEINGSLRSTILSEDQFDKLCNIVRKLFGEDAKVTWKKNELCHFIIDGRRYHWFMLCFTLIPEKLGDPQFYTNWICYKMNLNKDYQHPVDYIYERILKEGKHK